MGTSTSFNGNNSLRFQCFVTMKKFTVLLGENVIGHNRHLPIRTHAATQFQSERRFTTSHGSTNAYGEGSFLKIPLEGGLSLVKMTGMIHVLMGVTVLSVMMGVIMSMMMGMAL
jgi:hypothetical protein